MFIGCSLNPSYFEEKVNVFVALAPVVKLDHIKNKFIYYASKI